MAEAGRKKVLIDGSFIEKVTGRLRENQKVRRRLPGGGRLHIDRRLPFLLVYRRPARSRDEGTGRLVVGEASYMVAPADRKHQDQLSALVRGIAEEQSRVFEAFLLLEIWTRKARPTSSTGDDNAAAGPFRIEASSEGEMSRVLEALEWGLKRMKVDGNRYPVELVHRRNPRPAGMKPLLPEDLCGELNVHRVGVSLPAIHYDPESGEPYPLLLRKLHRRLSKVFKMGFYEFTRFMTSQEPASYHALGRRTMVKAVWEVDRMLSEIEATFDFLLMASPSNPDQAWTDFKRNRYGRKPEFQYRPIPADPTLLKRALYRIPIEKVEDPTIAYIFREKQEELDRLISMLSDRGTKRFFYGSLQVFGGIGEELRRTAFDLLGSISPRKRDGTSRGTLDARAFSDLARREIEHYRLIYPELDADVEVRGDISGLLVSRNRLLVGKSFRATADRAEALLQHEIGTHLLTYVNATLQPFRQLRYGLAGYSDLQEGLAVLSEYLAGGLNSSRVRLMAGRVAAINFMIEGATFVEVFRELVFNYGFTRKLAYRIVLKTFRGGGLTKDAAYLRGLLSLLKYLEKGGDIDILFMGKVNRPHLPLMRELLSRKILTEPVLRPRYMDYPDARSRLDLIRGGVALKELLK